VVFYTVWRVLHADCATDGRLLGGRASLDILCAYLWSLGTVVGFTRFELLNSFFDPAPRWAWSAGCVCDGEIHLSKEGGNKGKG